jgi:hypothetical protein
MTNVKIIQRHCEAERSEAVAIGSINAIAALPAVARNDVTICHFSFDI